MVRLFESSACALIKVLQLHAFELHRQQVNNSQHSHRDRHVDFCDATGAVCHLCGHPRPHAGFHTIQDRCHHYISVVYRMVHTVYFMEMGRSTGANCFFSQSLFVKSMLYALFLSTYTLNLLFVLMKCTIPLIFHIVVLW